MRIKIDDLGGNWHGWTLTDAAGRVVARAVPVDSYKAALASAKELMFAGVDTICGPDQAPAPVPEKRDEP